MPPSPAYTDQPWNTTFSEIIDVRSPSEFAEDHLPGAINLPVLDDQERAKVGILYKQVSPFTARKVGAALVAANVSRHLSGHFADQEKDYQPLVYCWRGGQRSNSMAMILCQIGWRVTVIQGGYKTYRAYVREQLEQVPQQFDYQVLCGLTGTGKTHLLQKLIQAGAQVLDLEGLARHRGSLLGEEWQIPQPSQKWFESLLLQQFQQFDPQQPVWVEAESNKVGQIYLPRSLWQCMTEASGVEVRLPLAQRVQHLLQNYPHLIAHPQVGIEKLERLKPRYGSAKLAEWVHLIQTAQWEKLVEDLLLHHYDPTYRHALGHGYDQGKRVLNLEDLSDPTAIPSLLGSAVACLQDG
jgi:tRNA 2-selenouridine synthase